MPDTRNILLLDGGTGHLLKRQGLRIEGLPYDQQFLAGVVAVAEQPSAVLSVHAAYLDLSSGADVVTSNSFAAAPRALRLLPADGRGGVRARLWRRLVSELEEDARDAAADLRLSVALAGEAARMARRAADAAARGGIRRRPARVAGSLPPLGECCYARAGAAPPPPRAEAAGQYLALARALRKGGADLLLAETLPSSEEALAALDAAAALAAEEKEEEGREEAGGRKEGFEVWVSFTVRDEGGGGDDGGGDDDGVGDGRAPPAPSPAPRLRGGEALEPALRRVLAHPAAGRLLTAVLVNCCAPAAASAALPVLVRCCCGGASSSSPSYALKVGAYANGFRGTTSEWLLQLEAATTAREEGDGGAAAAAAAAAAAGAMKELERATRWAEARHRARPGDFEAAEEEGEGQGSDGVEAAMTPEAYARYADEWIGLGATIVGGCCGIGPRHVERMAAALAASMDSRGDGDGPP